MANRFEEWLDCDVSAEENTALKAGWNAGIEHVTELLKNTINDSSTDEMDKLWKIEEIIELMSEE